MSTENRERVMMPTLQPFIGVDDLATRVTGPDARMGIRFTMDVAAEALAKAGPHIVERVAQLLGERVARECQADIERAVHTYLNDGRWAEPIVRDAIREAVHQWVSDVMASSNLGEAFEIIAARRGRA